MKVKLDVERLCTGMYVAELDRPWIGTPFLFQGFLIETPDEISQLKDCCEFVFVDDLQSRQDREVQDVLRSAIGPIRSGKVKAITVEFEEWTGGARLRSTLEKLNKTVEKSRTKIDSVLEDVKLGRSVQAAETREVIHNLVDNVSRNPQTAQWMTVLQSENQLIAQHSMNVSVLATTFGRFMGWPEPLLNVVSEGALLHDAGMSRVPQWILEKKGALTRREFDLVRMHADYASRLLKQSGDYDPRVIEIVRHHHERVDGSGYPDRLLGSEIPAYVQLVSIVDVYESMTADKPYESALTPPVALTRIHKRAGTHFDTKLVESFIRCIGIYPLSSLVRLKNGALGIVVSSTEENRLKPVVLLVRGPDGKDLMPRRMINLLALETVNGGWGIDSIADAEIEGIDPRRILVEEFMLR